MSGPAQVLRQRDFSAGELVPYAKRRDDEPIVRAGARSMENLRPVATGSAENRPGRVSLFGHEGRIDEVRMSADATYRLCFGAGTLTIRDADSGIVATQSGYAWTVADGDQIVWDVFGRDVFMCFPGQIPKIARWDGSTTWTFLDFAFTTTSAGRKLAPFYRFARPGITMSLSALTGSGVTVTFSAAVLTAGHVGTRFRYYDKQITITVVTSGTVGTATVNEVLRGVFSWGFTDVVTDQFAVGDFVEGGDGGARRYVAQVGTPDNEHITVIKLNSNLPVVGETTTGPSGEAEFSTGTELTTGPAIAIWDEEVMTSARGWPRSVRVDQSRLIFCDFVAIPEGIAWSAVSDPTNLYIGAGPADGFFELAPKKSRVLHVVGGQDEFILTDNGVYYIPVSESNPLQPGSVSFRNISPEPASKVEPVETPEGVVFVGAGLNRILAIVGTGQTTRPYLTRAVSEWHAHLFDGVRCLEAATGLGSIQERYVFAVNDDGSMAVGRYDPGKEWVGWTPWTGLGEVRWVSALGDTVMMSVDYEFTSSAEVIATDQYLDGVISNLSDDLSFYDGATVDLMQGRKYLGQRQIVDGAIVLEEGDDFSEGVVAGFGWTATLEPFLAHAQPGASAKQSMKDRQIMDGAVAVQDSTGYQVEVYRENTEAFERANDVADYNAGDNQDAEPPLREKTTNFKAPGTYRDPRVRIVKSTPGPLRILEFGAEIGV